MDNIQNASEIVIDKNWFLLLSESIDNMNMNVTGILSKVNRLEEQLEASLVLQAKVSEEIEGIKKNIDYLSSISSDTNTKLNLINAKLNDNEMNVDKLDDQLQDISQTLSTIPGELQLLADSTSKANSPKSNYNETTGIIY